MKGEQVRGSEVDGVAVAAIAGDIDIANDSDIAFALRRIGLTSGVGLVIDLSDVRYIDSSGVTMLFALRQDLDRSRLAVAVVVPDTSPVRRLLKVTAFDEVVPTLPTVDDAVAVLRAGVYAAASGPARPDERVVGPVDERPELGPA